MMSLYLRDLIRPYATIFLGWFIRYNGRQTIEAGTKETKQVFFPHHIKVRSEPTIFLQECFVLFADNLIRWATHRLAQQALLANNSLMSVRWEQNGK
jgi:hypothetical protein